MKKYLLIALLIFTGLSMAMAQEAGGDKREQMIKEVQEYRMKFLAQEMELSETQKKKFFDIYNKMWQDKRECYKEARKLERQLKQQKDVPEAEYQRLSQAMNTANANWAEKEKVYNQQFAEFLSQKQLYKMREAEAAFKKKLDEMRHNHKKDHKKHDDK